MNGSTPWINHQVNNLPFNPFKALKNPWKYKAGKPTKSLISTYLHFAKLTTSEPVHEVHPQTGSKTAAKTQGFVVEHCLCHCYMKLKEHAEITWLNAPFLIKHLKKCFLILVQPPVLYLCSRSVPPVRKGLAHLRCWGFDTNQIASIELAVFSYSYWTQTSLLISNQHLHLWRQQPHSPRLEDVRMAQGCTFPSPKRV